VFRPANGCNVAVDLSPEGTHDRRKTSDAMRLKASSSQRPTPCTSLPFPGVCRSRNHGQARSLDGEVARAPVPGKYSPSHRSTDENHVNSSTGYVPGRFCQGRARLWDRLRVLRNSPTWAATAASTVAVKEAPDFFGTLRTHSSRRLGDFTLCSYLSPPSSEMESGDLRREICNGLRNAVSWAPLAITYFAECALGQFRQATPVPQYQSLSWRASVAGAGRSPICNKETVQSGAADG